MKSWRRSVVGRPFPVRIGVFEVIFRFGFVYRRSARVDVLEHTFSKLEAIIVEGELGSNSVISLCRDLGMLVDANKLTGNSAEVRSCLSHLSDLTGLFEKLDLFEEFVFFACGAFGGGVGASSSIGRYAWMGEVQDRIRRRGMSR